MIIRNVIIYIVLNTLSLFSCLCTKSNPVDLVYPLLDTEHSRWFYFSSASRPFGMVNLSPDTEIDGAWGAGYRYNTTNIKGFSHIHAWQMSGISVMPVVLKQEQDLKGLFKDSSSDFLHEKEVVKPGYHRLYLERYGIDVELTSTKRVGFHHYSYKSKFKKAIMFNLNGVLGPCKNINGKINKLNPTTIIGEVENSPTIRRPKPIRIFFVAELSSPINDIKIDETTGNYMLLLDNASSEIYMKIAISYTSVDNASNNMKEELSGWNFKQIINESFDEWNSMLSRIEVKGGTYKERRRFYTDLWHSLQGRRMINDCNGAYPDNTGNNFRIGQIPLSDSGKPIHNHYNSDAFWGAQFSLNTLWGLVYPDVYEDFVHSLLLYYKDGGIVPRGPSGGNYTYVMTGATSTPFIVSAVQKGIFNDNLEYVYAAIRKNHLPGGIMEKAGYEHKSNTGGGLKYYMSLGYVPYPNPEPSNAFHQEGAGLTMEYSYQDYALSQMALRLDHENDYIYFYNRSMNYKNLYDNESGWIRPKDKNGVWRKKFDPYEYKHGFVESNAAQMTWFVPHDIHGLAFLMGGNLKAVEKLEKQFKDASKLNFTSGTSHSVELHPEYSRIPINYGNQPSIQTAFIFHKLGYPHLSDYWSKEIIRKAFSGLSPNSGYNGDEDQGIMSSISVLMKIGLFQLDGGVSISPEYQIVSPVFDKVKIKLHSDYYSGKYININKKKSNRLCSKSYILWNGKELENHSVIHRDFIHGGNLEYFQGKN